MQKKIPVTVISWFLWSWKTTLLQNILVNRKWLKVALIVNDMAELNIDAILINNSDVSLNQVTEKMIEISNGCICCTLREDLIIEVKNLILEDKYDYIIIESTGISEPLPIAQTLTTLDEESGVNLWELVYIDAMITVVDAINFMQNFSSYDTVSDAGWEILELERSDDLEESDDRNIVDLLVDQIEFADIIILNKVDGVLSVDLDKIISIVKWLNNSAELIQTNYSKVDFEKLIWVNLFDMELSSQKASRIQELSKWHHVSEILEYWISSFIYRSNDLINQNKFIDMLNLWFWWIVRAKWFISFDHDSDSSYIFSLSGNIAKIDPAWYKDDSIDYNQEIVFIWIDYDKDDIISRINECVSK